MIFESVQKKTAKLTTCLNTFWSSLGCVWKMIEAAGAEKAIWDENKVDVKSQINAIYLSFFMN